jgi:hypothetical protein
MLCDIINKIYFEPMKDKIDQSIKSENECSNITQTRITTEKIKVKK